MNRNKTYSIGVIGHTGMVGSQVYKYFRKKHPTFGVSVYPNGSLNGSWEVLNKKCEIVFVCVPTPFNFKTKKSNFSIVNGVLKKITPSKIIIIKSTVWPGTTEKLQTKHPSQKLLFNPEFLSRTTAQRDFTKPDRQIVGYTQKSKSSARKILNLLPKGKYSRIVKAAEAELIKYSHNVYGALRIIYANHLYEVCKKMELNYEDVALGFSASEFVGPGVLRYMKIYHNNKRGYGGPCFPKDVNAYIEFCRQIGVASEIVMATRNANRRILAEQGLNEEQVQTR